AKALVAAGAAGRGPDDGPRGPDLSPDCGRMTGNSESTNSGISISGLPTIRELMSKRAFADTDSAARCPGLQVAVNPQNGESSLVPDTAPQSYDQCCRTVLRMRKRTQSQ